MPKTKSKPKPKRKTPLSSSSVTALPKTKLAPALSAKLTQSTISKFHTLLKRKAQLEGRLKTTASSADHAKLETELSEVKGQMDALGGLERYQTMSKVGQGRDRGGDSSKVFVEWLVELGLGFREVDDNGKAIQSLATRLSLLEIGALSPKNYAAQSSWINNTPVDLHSQHPAITEQDFMQRPMPTTSSERSNLISCSLVLNFVPDPKERGRMLYLTREHLIPSSESLLFLVLPLPCVQNSRYLSRGLLVQILKEIGYTLVKERMKEGGKVGYWLFRWAEPVQRTERTRRKKIICDGPGKNNFAIVLEDAAEEGEAEDGEQDIDE